MLRENLMEGAPVVLESPYNTACVQQSAISLPLNGICSKESKGEGGPSPYVKPCIYFTLCSPLPRPHSSSQLLA